MFSLIWFLISATGALLVLFVIAGLASMPRSPIILPPRRRYTQSDPDARPLTYHSLSAPPQHPLLSRPPNPALDIVTNTDGNQNGGQSNRALLKLMKTIEEEIDARKAHEAEISIRTENALFDAGYTFQEAARAVTQMASAEAAQHAPIEVYAHVPEYDEMLIPYPESEQ